MSAIEPGPKAIASERSPGGNSTLTVNFCGVRNTSTLTPAEFMLPSTYSRFSLRRQL